MQVIYYELVQCFKIIIDKNIVFSCLCINEEENMWI